MKKFFALLLAALMLLSCVAFAEEAPAAVDEIAIVDEVLEDNNGEGTVDGITYTLYLENIPEGYTQEIDYTLGFPVMTIMNPDNDECAVYSASIFADQEEYGDSTFADLSEEDVQDFIADISEVFDSPTVLRKETGHGTPFIEFIENDNDYATLACLYKGYIIYVSFSTASDALTESELTLAETIMTDLWPVERTL